MNLSKYRVAASCFEPCAEHGMDLRREVLLAHISELIETQKPDLVVLPETVIAMGICAEARYGAEPLDGATLALLSKIAAGSSTNICIGIIEDDGGRLFNTAAYVDRTGKIAGTYRKQVPTPEEIRCGILPGSTRQEPVVLDGLRIGTSICFDQNFPDQMWHWIEAGVDLLMFPAYTYAGEITRNWAVNCGVPIVCAFPWESVIYDRDGTQLAIGGTETSTVRGGFHPNWICCSLNLRRRVCHLDGNQARLKELMSKYGSQVDVRLMVRDGRMMITPVSDDTDMDGIERELGLVRLQDYLRQSRRLAQSACETRERSE